MKYPNTTSPMQHRRFETRFTGVSAQVALMRAAHIHFDLIGLYYAEAGPDWSSRNRAESDSLHHVDLVISGEASIRHQGKTTPLEPGYAYFFPGNTPLVRECRERYETLFLKFRCEWLPGVDLLLDWPGRRPVKLGRWDLAEWPVRHAPDAPASANVILRWKARLALWLTEAIENLDQVISDHVRENTCFARAFELIDQQLSAELRVEDLSRAQGIGLQSFSRAFSRRLGVSPKAYLNRRLSEEAIRHVINSDLTMKEIAHQLRFSDEYYFSRFFQKMNGQAPMHYRQSFLKRP